MARAFLSMAAGVIAATLASGFPGTTRGDTAEISFLNDGGSAQFAQTVTVGSTSASTVHSFGISCSGVPGQTISYTSADSTAANAAAGLETALRRNAIAYGLMSVSRSGAVLTLTGRKHGQSITLGSASNVTLGSATSAADAERVEAGRALFRTGRDTQAGNVVKGRKAVSSVFSAQRISHAVTTQTGARFWGEVSVNGRVIPWGPVAHDTNDATTAAAIATAINTAVDDAFAAGQSVLADNSSGTLRITADVPGTAFESRAWCEGAASTAITKAYTTGAPADPATSAAAAFLGFSAYGPECLESGLGTNDPAIPANAGGRAHCDGPGLVYLETSETPTAGGGVYIDLQTTTAADRGKAYTALSASSSRVALWDPSLGWVCVWAGDNDTTNSLAAIRFLRRAPGAI